MNRHFTVSVYVVHNNRVLLRKHKKAQILLVPKEDAIIEEKAK